MPLHLRTTLVLLVAALVPAVAAGVDTTTPSFESVAAGKPQTESMEIAPSPVSYGLEASIDASGRVAIRCRAGESPTYRRWRAALDQHPQAGAAR